jgi:large subunit ribosomal protein L15
MPKPQKTAGKSKSASDSADEATINTIVDKTPLLSRLRAPVGAVQKKHRLGRGSGGGWGTTAGRGQKGQYARNTVRPGFEGGQTPLYRRLPKIGFKNPFSLVVMTVNIEQLKRFDAGSKVDVAQFTDYGLVKGKFDKIKILGEGELDRALTVRAHAFSARAKEQIEKAGGTVEVIDPPKVYARHDADEAKEA